MKTNHHEIAFERADGSLGRFRPVYLADSPQHAVEHTLHSLRGGALKRFAARRPSIKAFVACPGDPRHDNGRPILLHGFTLNLTPTP